MTWFLNSGAPWLAAVAAVSVLGGTSVALAQQSGGAPAVAPQAGGRAAVGAGEALSLDQVLQLVQERNETWEITEARIAQARGARRQAWAGLLPQLSAQAQVTRNGQEISVGGSPVQRQYDWGVGGRASVVLFNGTLYPMLSRSGKLLEAAQALASWQRRSVIFEATQAFYLLAAAETRVQIAERTLELRQAQLARAEALLEARLGVRLDVEVARTQQLQAQQDVLEARAMLGNARDALGMLLVLEPDAAPWTDLGQVDLADAPLDAPPARAEGDALARRLDLEASRRQIDALELNRSAIWAGFLPAIDLSANANYGPSRAFSNPSGFGWALTLTATWLLYDGGLRYAQLEQIEGQISEQTLSYQRELRQAGVGLRSAHRAWQTAVAGVGLARQQVESARQAFESAQARFDNGLITSIDVADASERLFQAEVSLNQRVLTARTAAAEYQYLSGLMGQDQE